MYGTVLDILKAFNKSLVTLNEEEMGYKRRRKQSKGGEIALHLQ